MHNKNKLFTIHSIWNDLSVQKNKNSIDVFVLYISTKNKDK